MADASQQQQQQLLQLQDAMHKEWLAVQRRYHAQQINDTPDSSDNNSSPSDSQLQRQQTPNDSNDQAPLCIRARCFISLSDPDLPEQFKGETEVQFELPPQYPALEPVFDLAHFRSRLSAEQFAALDAAMKTRARELRGTLSLRKLLTWLDNNFYPVTQLAAGSAESSRAPSDSDDAKHAQASAASEPDAASQSTECAVDTVELIPTSTSDATREAVGATKQQQTRRDKRASVTPCKFFLRESCRRGDACKYAHVAALVTAAVGTGDASALSQSASLPAQPQTKTKPKKAKTKPLAAEQAAPSLAEAKPTKPVKTRIKTPRACRFFANGTCRDGDTCKFLHERKHAGASTESSTHKRHDAATDESLKPESIVVKEIDAPDAPAAATDASSSASDVPDSIDSSANWSETQQKALDAALKTFPASLDKKLRWRSIANDVPGKSLNDCIDRYTLLSRLVRDAHAPSKAVSVVPAVPEVSVVPAVPAVPEGPEGPEPVAPVPAGESTQESSLEPDDSSSVDKRIIAPAARVAIETDPEARGAQIRLDELFLHHIGTLVPHRLVCQVQCTNCPLKFDAPLALDSPSVRTWCPRCSVLHVVTMRPVFAHASSDVVAYVDTNENCRVVDVVPSDMLATCLDCSADVLFPCVTPLRRAESACFSCHSKLALQLRRFVVGHVSNSSVGKHKTSGSSAKTTAKRVVDNFVLGQPLPNRGVCAHYRHSQRWFRFQCCGRAFPCDVCHDASDCAEANMGTIASRMICGLCSKEQSSAVKACACGNDVGRKKVGTAHWEGGAGCRDPTRMAVTEKKKFRGLHKTASKKHTRVGAAAKATRAGNAQATSE